MTPLYAIGQEIAIRRKALKLTQSQLGIQAGTSRATIDALENARTGEIGYTKLSRILAVLGRELRLHDANQNRPTLDELLAERGAEAQND